MRGGESGELGLVWDHQHRRLGTPTADQLVAALPGAWQPAPLHREQLPGHQVGPARRQQHGKPVAARVVESRLQRRRIVRRAVPAGAAGGRGGVEEPRAKRVLASVPPKPIRELGVKHAARAGPGGD